MTTTLDFLIQGAERRVLSTADDLKWASQNLSESMARLSKMSAAVKLNEWTGINSLGEVQGAGASIDRLCILLAERQDELERLIQLRADQAGR